MKSLFFCLLQVWLMGTFLYSQPSQPHVPALAEPGDGIYSFLDKFQVKSPCNLKYFYKLNGLRSKQGLRSKKQYYLPILIYTYNGKSIRSTTGINDRPWAEQIQQYNELMHQMGLKTEDYRKDKELWVPYNRLHCREENTPLRTPVASGNSPAQPTSGSVPLRGTYPIFGDKYAQVPLESTTLSGCVYYVVSGHGGPDPGAVGRYGRYNLCEDEYAYDISLRLTRNLLAHGATVYQIIRDKDDGIREGEILPCDKDEECWVQSPIPINQKARLTQRSDAVNALYQKNRERGVGYQRLIVIHIDSDSKREKIDMYFYHKYQDQKSLQFANRMKQTIRTKYEQYRKGRGYTGTVSSRDLHMLRETEPTAIFMELGNIRNRNDQSRFVIEGNRQLVANWLFEGLLVDARSQ
ncbi:MAG: N-acetylmuramoyl-L-alanine amidase [Bacteroidota bacterium]